MKKTITGITAVLLVGTSVKNPGSTTVNHTKKSDINSVYAEESDNEFSTSDAGICGRKIA